MPLRGFVGGSNPSQSYAVNAERTVNLYPESRDVGTPKANTWLLAMPGLSAWLSIGTGPIRAMFEQDGRAFVITGTDFREIFADATSVSRGTVAAGLDTGTIISNGDGGNQLLVVVGGYGYVFGLTTNTLTQIVDVDFPQGRAAMCAFLDGYGIVQVRNSGTFQISALEDFTSWDALDIAQKSQTPDRLVSISADLDHKVLRLLGSASVENWWDSGAAAFPFEPVPNSIASIGCGAAFAVVQSSKGLLWVAENSDGGRMLYADAGGAPKRASTHAVEAAWASYGSISDMVGFAFLWRGHEFCVFTCSSGTWVYDTLENEWFEWLEWDTTIGDFVPHLATAHIFAFDKHIVGSRSDGALYTLEVGTFTDNSLPVRRLRRAPHVFAYGSFITCNKLRFDFQVGVGLTTEQGSNPEVMLRVSRDGSRTFGTERWKSLGAIGAGTTRVEYRQNGRWRDGGIEIAISDPVVVALTGAWGEFDAEGAA